jgi:hypothetical protein
MAGVHGENGANEYTDPENPNPHLAGDEIGKPS